METIRAKAALRAGLLAARAGRLVADSAFAALVLGLPEVAAARCVAAYVSLPGEPGTACLLTGLAERGVAVILPAVTPDRDLRFLRYDGLCEPGPLGTLQPTRGAPVVDLTLADVVVVPALAVDLAGHRLGRGGGSYDRALVRVRPFAPVVAMVWDDEVIDSVPVEPHDRPVDICVTDQRVIRLFGTV